MPSTLSVTSALAAAFFFFSIAARMRGGMSASSSPQQPPPPPPPPAWLGSWDGSAPVPDSLITCAPAAGATCRTAAVLPTASTAATIAASGAVPRTVARAAS
eukprot:4116689-Prymnesium_polylepis.1